jgi:hypothetical protein
MRSCTLIVSLLSAGCSGGPPLNFGLVVATSETDVQNGATTEVATAGAQFVKFRNSYADAFHNCPEQTYDACTVATCAQCDPSSSSCIERAPLDENADAGRITIGGASAPITLVRDPMNGYALFMQQNLLWAGGEMLSFHADGADVPGFDAQAAAPSQVTLTTPVQPTAGQEVAVRRATDFHLAWTTGAGQLHVAMIGANRANAAAILIDCYFPMEAGSGVIPSGVWQATDTGAASFDVNAVGHSVIQRAGWEITAEARSPVTWPDGTKVSAGIALQ